MILAVIQAVALAVPLVQPAPPLDGSLQHDAWKSAKTVTLDWDLQGHKPAPQQTTAYVETDGKFLYVAFDAKQPSAIVATQHTDDTGQGADDDVEVDLWPGGSNAFNYQFIANPIGTHYQSSSENSGYRPQWWSAGAVRDGEYVVTMKIPLSAMHVTGSSTWLVQFARRVENTGDIDVWSYDTNETSPDSVVYAGTMTGVHAAALRPQPRVELYALGSVAGTSIGGSTSRMGVDLSVPFTATSSFYATIHPDYSNVELDQQSISPTAFRRFYHEVRPFFTQGNATYNNFDCDMCNGIMSLYTPAIPTPRRGYAVEGKQGAVTYGAFDAIGDGRTDSAQSLSWRNRNHTLSFSVQRVGVNVPGVGDDTLEAGTTFNDGKRIFGYFNYGIDTGTNVRDARKGQYYDFGSGYFTPTTAVGFAVRKEGAYFNPLDGFVWHTDTAGYGVFFSHAWLYGNNSPLRSITVSNALSRYHDNTGELNDTTQGASVDFLTRGLIDVNLGVGSGYVRFTPGGIFYPNSSNGISLTFGSGADNSSVNNGAQHGSSATPTTLSYFTGRFGPGRLNSWSLISTMKAMRRGLLTFEADGNFQLLDAGGRHDQWLERVSYTYQADRNTSFALGVRRIIGEPPVFDALPQQQRSWNLSAAYHRTFNGQSELYAVYGDASAFSTIPQFIIKWIRYFGAGKGS
ncbi:MAG TPA: hypothetical protein VFN37_04575 [Candidatus Baltobacteraceae bacterium]|nr:hypothetical protein [Candidatus Baltobacteraceae bacterium]